MHLCGASFGIFIICRAVGIIAGGRLPSETEPAGIIAGRLPEKLNLIGSDMAEAVSSTLYRKACRYGETAPMHLMCLNLQNLRTASNKCMNHAIIIAESARTPAETIIILNR